MIEILLKMVKIKSSKMCNAPYIFLEDYEFYHGGLIEIATGKRKEMIKQLRKDFSASKFSDNLKKGLLDISIVVQIRKGRYRRQDLDNLAKIILDALEKPKEDDSFDYLYEDDNQIVRLIIYKLERVECSESETSQLSISARIHDSGKEMILRELK